MELAKQEVAGLEAAGVTADLYQIPETLPEEVLQKMNAPPKPSDIPVATVDILTEYDGFLFGFSTRFGTYAAQFKSFWDATGGLWAQGALHGKFVGIFLVTGGQGGGQESLARNTISNFVHHGLIYVPLGYKETFSQLASLDEVHGGSSWGAGAFAGGDGSRQPSALEKETAFIQGKAFGAVVSRSVSGASRLDAAPSTAQSESTAVPSTTDDAAASAPKAGAAKAPVAAAPATKAAAPTTAPAATKAAAPAASQKATPQRAAERPTESKKKFGCCTVM